VRPRTCIARGASLDGRRRQALTCSANCGRDARIRAILAGAEADGYATPAEYQARRRNRANTALEAYAAGVHPPGHSGGEGLRAGASTSAPPDRGPGFLRCAPEGVTWGVSTQVPPRCGNGRGRTRRATSRSAPPNEALNAILTDARRGTLAVNRTGATFDDAAAEYLRYVEQVKKIGRATLSDYRGVVAGYLSPRFGSRALDSITPEDVERYRDELDSEGRLSARVIVRHLTVLHGIFRRAMRVWGLTVNPAAAELVERPPVRYSGEFKTLTPDEVRLAAAHAGNDQDAALIVAAAFTGLRMGELLGLRWEDVDFANERVQVRRNFTDDTMKTPKSGKVRSSPMVPEVMAALDGLSRREYLTEPGDPVFPTAEGEHGGEWGVRRRFYATLERAGLPRVHFHDLRHCFATLAVQKLPLPTVQGYMGHAHISTTMRYVHHSPATEDAAKLAEALEDERPAAEPAVVA
jgi:integrase